MKYLELRESLKKNKKRWLVTGAAGFIGSNIVRELLKLNQEVVGLDNFATGHKRNLEQAIQNILPSQTKSFKFIEGSIEDFVICQKAMKDINHVSHQAAIGSVPRSIEKPIETNSANISGFLNILLAAKDQKVESFTYAASSSTYGDSKNLPKKEDTIGKPLSPYALTKYVNELYADVFSLSYDFHCVGLRYFNVFGRRQDPDGAYAAVIPKWVKLMMKNEPIVIYGDGSTTRDFCYIDNVVQANILSSNTAFDKSEVFNVAVGSRTSLLNLFKLIKNNLKKKGIKYTQDVLFAEFRKGDVLHSQADINKAIENLNYRPTHSIEDGIKESIDWYVSNV